MDSIAAASTLWRSPRVWAVVGLLASALSTAAIKAWDVGQWASERASRSDVRALEIELGRVVRLERENEQLRNEQTAAFRELAAAWAAERVPPGRRAPATTEQREDAANRARGHFNRLLVRDGYAPAEALAIALRQIDAAR